MRAVVAICPARPDGLARMVDDPWPFEFDPEGVVQTADGVARGYWHAMGDERVPWSSTFALAGLTADPMRLHIAPGGDHGSLQHDPAVIDATVAFLAEHLSVDERRRPGGAGRGDRRLPGLPAPGGLAGGGGPGPAARVRRPGLLGPPGAGVRRPRSGHAWSSAWRPRRTAPTAPGRVFTGDRSGDFLFAALHRAGLASQPTSTHAGRRAAADRLPRDRGGALRAPRQPARRPTSGRAASPSSSRELALCPAAPGCCWRWARSAGTRSCAPWSRRGPWPRFGHGAEASLGRLRLIGCYHPSQQNVFTGRLTADMMDEVLARCRAVAGLA